MMRYWDPVKSVRTGSHGGNEVLYWDPVKSASAQSHGGEAVLYWNPVKSVSTGSHCCNDALQRNPVKSASTGAFGYDGILHRNPAALRTPSTRPTRLAVPPEQGLGDGAAGLTRHAGGDGAGPPVPAAPLPQPARPEAQPQVLPGELHGAVGEAPHQLLQPSPLLLPALQPHPPPVREPERPQVPQVAGAGLVGSPAFKTVHEALVGVHRLVHGQELLVKLAPEATAQHFGVEVSRGRVQGLVGVLQQVLYGELVGGRGAGSLLQGGHGVRGVGRPGVQQVEVDVVGARRSAAG